MSSRDLPPLAAVRVFEAAARHLSFTRAAQELGMTQAAVSYQVKLLEGRVGTPLFLRRPRALCLTEAGEALRPRLTAAFDSMAAAFCEVASAQGLVLSVILNPTFATHWLVPRLGTFQARNPRFAVQLNATKALADFDRDEVDVVIQATKTAAWEGIRQEKLFELNFTPMMNPALLARTGPLRNVEDFRRVPLVSPYDPWWRIWFEAAGLPPPDRGGFPELCMGSQHLEARMAIAGQGAAILTPAFYAEEIAAGLLCQPFDLACTEGTALWLCYPEARRNVPKIRALRDWLIAEIASDETSRQGREAFAARPA